MQKIAEERIKHRWQLYLNYRGNFSGLVEKFPVPLYRRVNYDELFIGKLLRENCRPTRPTTKLTCFAGHVTGGYETFWKIAVLRRDGCKFRPGPAAASLRRSFCFAEFLKFLENTLRETPRFHANNTRASEGWLFAPTPPPLEFRLLMTRTIILRNPRTLLYRVLAYINKTKTEIQFRRGRKIFRSTLATRNGWFQ